MKTIITNEKDVEQHKEKFAKNLRLIHFKLVGVGTNTMTQAEHLGSNVCGIVREMPGYFIITQDGQDVRAALHDLVNRFCDAYEGKNEPTKQTSE